MQTGKQTTLIDMLKFDNGADKSAHDDLIIFTITHLDQLGNLVHPSVGNPHYKYTLMHTDYKLEQPITRSNGFIIGFVDVWLTAKYSYMRVFHKGDTVQEAHDGWGQKYYDQDGTVEAFTFLNILIECKTSKENITLGNVLRQMKTYATYLDNPNMFLITDYPLENHANILKHEGILPIFADYSSDNFMVLCDKL